jgi:predicted nucleotidyltransferase
MWKMETEHSDHDLMNVYIADTTYLLKGYTIARTLPDRFDSKTNTDIKAQELGHLINQLIKGNVNAIWTVCSPIIVNNHPTLDQLRNITLHNLSKASYNSINGMAWSQYLDHTRRKNVMPEGKALMTSLRTLLFGYNLLKYGQVLFTPVLHIPTELEVLNAKETLQSAYTESTLPDTVNEIPFRDFLITAREQWGHLHGQSDTRKIIKETGKATDE